MEIWPAYLPKPTRNFGFKSEGSSLRTQMSTGRFRQRRRFSTDRLPLRVRWDLTDEQLDQFRTFVYYNLNGANDYCQMTVYLGNGLRTVKARFVGADYNVDHNTNGVLQWTVSAELELETTPYTDPNTGGSGAPITTIGGEQLETIAGDAIVTL